jgi:hypothetical protein
MRAWLLVLAACTDGAVTGIASSSRHPDVRSATALVENIELFDPPGTYRRWIVLIAEAAPGTACEIVGEPLISIELYTIFSSAPRGEIPLSATPPPRVFPAAYATIADGVNPQGTVFISAAATTKLVGGLGGYATFDGVVRALDVTFEAPTCGP